MKYRVVNALTVNVSSGVKFANKMSAFSVGRNFDKIDLLVEVEEADELLPPVRAVVSLPFIVPCLEKFFVGSTLYWPEFILLKFCWLTWFSMTNYPSFGLFWVCFWRALSCVCVMCFCVKTLLWVVLGLWWKSMFVMEFFRMAGASLAVCNDNKLCHPPKHIHSPAARGEIPKNCRW